MRHRHVYRSEKLDNRQPWGILRLATGWKANHDNGNSSRVEEAARHCAIKLGRSHILILGDIVDAIDERGTLSAISRRISRDLCSAVVQVSMEIAPKLRARLGRWAGPAGRCVGSAHGGGTSDERGNTVGWIEDLQEGGSGMMKG